MLRVRLTCYSSLAVARTMLAALGKETVLELTKEQLDDMIRQMSAVNEVRDTRGGGGKALAPVGFLLFTSFTSSPPIEQARTRGA
jgi:hypothetical protein